MRLKVVPVELLPVLDPEATFAVVVLNAQVPDYRRADWRSVAALSAEAVGQRSRWSREEWRAFGVAHRLAGADLLAWQSLFDDPLRVGSGAVVRRRRRGAEIAGSGASQVAVADEDV